MLKVTFQSQKYTIIGNVPLYRVLSTFSRANSHSASPDNPIGVPFILMSEAPGRPLSKLWGQADSQSHLEINGRCKVLSQLGSITWKLSQLRFAQIGSLFEEDHTFIIKECLSRGHMMDDRCSLNLEIPRGPFSYKADFNDSLISALSEHAEALPLSHHCFSAPVPSQNDYLCDVQYRRAVDLWNDFMVLGCKVDSSNNRMDYILAADTLRGIIHQLDPMADSETFPLCHPDLSVNNIYVDEDYKITCIIDWEFASSVPEYMLLTTPGLPQYRNEVSSELQVSFIDGFVETIPDLMKASLAQKYRSKLERSQVAWKLSRLLNLDTINDYFLFTGLWGAAYGPEKDLAEYILQQRCSSHYVQRYNEVREEDQPLSKIEKEENDYFRKDVLRKTVAKKLTLVSGWETQYGDKSSKRLRKDMFVTSAKLWKWIQQFMKDWEDMS